MDQLAPTPIYRITEEQLQQLINRVVAAIGQFTDKERAVWQYQTSSFNIPQGGSIQVLTRNRNRVGFFAAGFAASGISLQPATVAVANTGINLPNTTNATMVLWDEWGYIVTEPWSAFCGVVGGVCSIIEITGPRQLV